METKVIALDVYGTILCSDDSENALGPRKGFEEFTKRCKYLDLILVTSSDASIPNLMIDLEASFRNSRSSLKPTLDIFNEFYKLKKIPKDYSQIIDDYSISPRELFVIGNSESKDLERAIALECNTRLVKEYSFTSGKNFDFNTIEIPWFFISQPQPKLNNGQKHRRQFQFYQPHMQYIHHTHRCSQ